MIKSKLTVLLAICSASLPGADFAGRYQLRGVMEVGSELMLRPDGTFEYMLAYGAANYAARGKWRIEGQNVILDTIGTSAPPFKLTRSNSNSDRGVRVVVKAPNGNPVPHIDVELGNERSRTDSEGVAFFEQAKAPKEVAFRIPVYQIEAGPYPVDPAHNEHIFEINGEAITQVNFKNEPLRINGATLEMRFWDKSKAMRYQRQ